MEDDKVHLLQRLKMTTPDIGSMMDEIGWIGRTENISMKAHHGGRLRTGASKLRATLTAKIASHKKTDTYDR